MIKRPLQDPVVCATYVIWKTWPIYIDMGKAA